MAQDLKNAQNQERGKPGSSPNAQQRPSQNSYESDIKKNKQRRKHKGGTDSVPRIMVTLKQSDNNMDLV